MCCKQSILNAAVLWVVNQSAVVPTMAMYVQGLELSHEKFIDLCVLCGCDYTGSIKGIGPKKALALVRQVRHHNLCMYVQCTEDYRAKSLCVVTSDSGVW